MNNFDRPLFWTFVGLTVFGLIMMSSMSVASSLEVAGNTSYYFWRHLIYILLGIPVFLLACWFPFGWIKRLSVVFYLATTMVLLFTLWFGEDLGTSARSWLLIGNFSFQPVELTKLSIVIILATVFSRGERFVNDFQSGFLTFCLLVGIPSVLIILQPDFGSLFVVLLIASSVYFIAGANLKHFALGALLAFLAGIIASLSNAYVGQRFAVFLNPDLDPLGAGFQVKQALIAIGSGGFFGRGFHNSIQKFDYLPEVQSDTIFAAIAEELGFVRILILLIAYGIIAWRGALIFQRSTDEFARLVAFGLTSWIVGQAAINIAVNLALFPNTGITLPLISYGGTSLWATFVAVGILLQISAQIQTHRKKHLWR